MAINPYAPKARSLLYGRETAVRELLKRERVGKSIVLTGGRRCGKTSLLNCLHRLLSVMHSNNALEQAWKLAITDAQAPSPTLEPTSPHLPVVSDLDGFALTSLEEVLSLIASDISTALAKAGCQLEPPGTNGHVSTVEMQTWLIKADAATDRTPFGGLALLIDQAEDLFSQSWCHDFMSFLRLLDDKVLRTRVWIMLAGSHRLDEYRQTDGSPLNTFERFDLTDLDYAARRRMISEPFVRAGRLPPCDAAARAIDRAAAGHPWLLTLMLGKLFEMPRLNTRAVQAVANQIFESEQETLTRWAKPLNDDGWRIYGDVVRVGRMPIATLKGSAKVAARRRLEYQGLVHRVMETMLETGPELFRRWAADEGRIQEPFQDRPMLGRSEQELPPGHYPYDVAISYASADLDLAREISDGLARLKISHFYDRQAAAELWGVDLNRALPATYGRDARIAVLLVSSAYVQRHWPMVEQRAAIERAIAQEWEGILIVSVDGTRLPDVPASVVVITMNSKGKTASDVVLALQERLNADLSGVG
jgi:hypothetical protein